MQRFLRVLIVAAVIVLSSIAASSGTWVTKAHAAIAPVIYYDGGGQPACGWGVGTWQGPNGITYYCIFDLSDYRYKWVTL